MTNILLSAPALRCVALAATLAIFATLCAAAPPSRVVVDIRAHTMPQWNANPVGVFTQLLNVTRQAVGWWTAFGKPVPYEVTIPNFFDNGNLLYTENGRTDVFLTWMLEALAAGQPGATVNVLNYRDTGSGLLQGGIAEMLQAASLQLPSRFTIEAADVGYDPGTFFEEGLVALRSALADVRASASSLVASQDPPLPPAPPLAYTVHSYEAVAALAALLGGTVPPPVDNSAPLDITVAVDDSAVFLAAGPAAWAGLWTAVARVQPLLRVTAVALDVTDAVATAPDSVQAFIDAAAVRNIGVALVLANQNWALADYHLQAQSALLATALLASRTPTPTSPTSPTSTATSTVVTPTLPPAATTTPTDTSASTTLPPPVYATEAQLSNSGPRRALPPGGSFSCLLVALMLSLLLSVL